MARFQIQACFSLRLCVSAVKTKSSLYPHGATNANWFTAFNALSFQITLGSPMILYAKSLGATATVLGVIASMTPLLTTCQIPAAHFLARVGYRRFILSGWGLRSLFIFVLAAVPLFGSLDNLSKLALVIFSLFIFNLLRGISSGAWLPWISDLIPESVRGRFLSRDQIFLHVGSLFSLLLGAVLLRGPAAPWQFALLFLISALAAAASLVFLQKTPDVDASDAVSTSTARVPWREIVFYPPFLRLVVFTLCFVFSLGSAGVFGVAFMKTKLGYSESQVLAFGVFYFLGALCSLPFVGRILDHTGSKLVLQLALAAFVLLQSAWWMLSTEMLVPSVALIVTLHFLGGIIGSNFGLAHTRLMMNTMPPMGRSHFFAFFSVISSIGLGVAPIFWGMLIDSLDRLHRVTGPVHWGKFGVYYFALLLLVMVTWAFTFFLHEKAGPAKRLTMREMLFTANLKRITRLWQR